MFIIKRVAPAIALLAMLTLAQPPIAQSMPLAETGKSVPTKVVYSKTPLSTNTKPSVIRSKVYRAWRNGEFYWSSDTQWRCFDNIIRKESAWSPWSTNGRGWEETGGIPQAHPSRKMATAGRDYRTNAWTQVRWGLKYIKSVYGTPCRAWSKWQYRAATGRYGWY